jgi:hypothetical protein
VLADGVHRWQTLGLEYYQVNTLSLKTTKPNTTWSRQGIAAALMVLGSLVSTGCQMDIAGQTLPSPYYLTDDVQYYAPGPEFRLAREAAALKEQSANRISETQR